MRINDKMLVLPPFISTTWGHVRALYMKGSDLIVSLTNGDNVAIPELATELLAKIFASHAAYLENKVQETPARQGPQQVLNAGFSVELPFKVGNGMENLGSAMHHNPAQASLPDLPAEILQKISSIAKIVSPEELASMPKPEPHCNCVHCQIVRTIQHSVSTMEEASKELEDPNREEVIADEELQFQQWEIIQTGDKLFSVTNRLDTMEHYNVFLGEPVGCTCGKQGCEHILAVLKS